MSTPLASRAEILGLSLERLTETLAPFVDRPFRARQVFAQLHHRGASSFEEMSDVAAEIRLRLAEHFTVSRPELVECRASDDGTAKYLLRLADGASIETVDIPDGERRTLCISSQAGCGLACAFCVTGHWGAGRSLTAAEIVGQVHEVRRLAALPPGLNLVFMGMGEPLLNLDALHDAIELLSETISPRRITVSTAGVVPGIEALGRWSRRPNLAVSLHAPDDERRTRLMPINRTWPIDSLLAALRRYPLEPRRRITIEYLLLDGFNDARPDADALAHRLDGLRVKVNLIPFNPDPVLPAWMGRPAPARVEAFRDRLESAGFTATVRRQRGDDVAAACGQLRAFARAPRGEAARRRFEAFRPTPR